MQIKVPARSGKAIKVDEKSIIKVINTYGGQVVDTWAFAANDPEEYLSMAHTRASIRRLKLQIGDVLVSNLRQPMITIMEDNSPGTHDFTMPPCDPQRYAQLGAPDHDNCKMNLHKALEVLDIHINHTPMPLNLFQNSPWAPDLTISFLPSPAKLGDNIVFRAERSLVLAFSCCPMDIMPIKDDLIPVGVDVEVLSPPEK